MKNLIFTCFLVIFSVSALFSEDLKTKKVDSVNEAPSFAGFVENEIVVKLDRSFLNRVTLVAEKLEGGLFGISELDKLGSRMGVEKIWQKIPHLKARNLNGRIIDPSSWFNIKFKTNTDIDLAVRAYKLLAGVVDAQPIGIHKIYTRTPNDANYADQWHLNQSNDADIDAPEAWDVQTGNSSIIVAILDTGVRYYHKDLGGANASSSNPGATQGNMWINTAEKNGTAGVDDDNNGFIDDWIGWDFVDGVTGWTGEDVSTPDNDPRDFNGHGTHCAGIVGAINNNNYAVSSPAGGWANGSQQVEGNGVKIMPLRIGYSGRYLFFLEVGYVRMDFAAAAFYYAADNGAKIASCSWGSSNTGGLGDAIDYFVAGGGLIFKAAGNDDNQDSDYMLDRVDVIGVASTDENDVKSDFSTYGDFVDISAPGSNIYSTYHDHTDAANDYVASLSGTSMATPLTASVASLIWSQNPSWSADQVRQQLYDTADDIYGISGNASYAGKLGAGRINAYQAVSVGSGPAAPVAGFSGSPVAGCGPLTVQFNDESTGGVTDWSWDFGDGGASGLQNPDHQYADPGKYTVVLTVTGDGGSDSETKTDYIMVYAPITADFSGTPVSGDAPLTVDFTDLSAGDVTDWSWDFGDGGTSSVQNPSHEYSNAGTYTVSLTASNSCDNDVISKTDYITVTEPPCDAPVADFTGSPLSGAAPLTVSFTDNSTNNPTSWSWNFGDGATSSEQNPTHEYANSGDFTVELSVSNSCGSDVETKTNYISVSEPSANMMHIGQMTVTVQSTWIFRRAKAEIKIVDSGGAAVASAGVSGAWSGKTTDTDNVTTGSNGVAVAYSNWTTGAGTFTFCVENVSKSGWTYDQSANVATCAGSDGSTSATELVANVSLDEIEGELDFKLATNSPNPFNPSTTISFIAPVESFVTVELYNILGQKVNTILNGQISAGLNSVTWNGDDTSGQLVSSGFYFYRITYNGKHSIIRKILMIK